MLHDTYAGIVICNSSLAKEFESSASPLLEDSNSFAGWTGAKCVEGVFSEVASALLTLHTGHVDQLEAVPTGPALY